MILLNYNSGFWWLYFLNLDENIFFSACFIVNQFSV